MRKENVNSSNCGFQVGDKVKVKKGVIDPDFNFEIGGWTGEMKESFFIENSRWHCRIIWDEKTLRKMGKKFINKCDRLNLDHTEMNLENTELEKFVEDSELEKDKETKVDSTKNKSLLQLILQRITNASRSFASLTRRRRRRRG